MTMILYEEILIYYYKYKYVYIYTLKNATSLEFTVQQIRILLQSSEPRNVLSVHPKNQFLNSDVFPTMYYNKFKKKLVLARILNTLTNYPFISVHVYEGESLEIKYTIPLQGFHSVLFKSRSWAFVTNPNFSISISLQPVVIDLKYFKQWIMLGQIV